MKTTVWSVLGTGHMAKKFIAAADSLGECCRIAAIGGRDELSAQRFCAQFAPTSAALTLENAVAFDNVDAVYIALPNQLHEEWTIAALLSGRAVLCEKPAAPHPNALFRMIAAARSAQRLFYEGFLYRSHPGMWAVRELLRNGAIGRPRMGFASFCFDAGAITKPRLLEREYMGGSLRDVGVYPLSWLRWMLDAEPQAAQGMAELTDDGVDSCAQATLRFPDHVQAGLRCSFRHGEPNAAVVFGTEGFMEIAEPWRLPEGTLNARLTKPDGTQESFAYHHPLSNSMGRQIALFQDHLHLSHLEIPEMSWEDSMKQAHAIDMIRSALGVTSP